MAQVAQIEDTYKQNEQVLQTVYTHSSHNPKDLTHIAIGSCPRNAEVAKFTPEMDQLMPAFIMKIIESTRKSIRIIHIDRLTQPYLSFLHEYFASFAPKGIYFRHNISNGQNIWTSDDNRIEVIFLFNIIRHRHDYYGAPTDIWFLEKMVETTLSKNNQLILMEYSGIDPIDVAKFLFKKSNQKDLFLKNILFDVSYGAANCHCAPNMTKYFPIYKSDGTFCNVLLYNYQEMLDVIGTDDKINDIIKIYFQKEYKFILDHHHLNYRRKVSGYNFAYHLPEYNESTPPDQIMQIIIDKLNQVIIIFEILGLSNNDKNIQIKDLFTNYRTVDMHKWWSQMLHMFD
jgi:hypothetical protein